MLLMQRHQDGLHRRLSVIGIPVYMIRPLVDLMIKWETCSGVEWSIKRLKSLKVDLIRSRTGLPLLTWIRKNSRGEVTGPIGQLFRWALSGEKNFARSVQALNAYTFYILPGLSDAQREKFLSGINPRNTDDGLDKEFHNSFSKTVRSNMRVRTVTSVTDPLVIYQGSPGKKAPRLFGRKSTPQNENILDDFEIFNTAGGIDLYSRYHRLFRPVVKGMGLLGSHLEMLTLNRKAYASRGMSWPRQEVKCGEIHFLQEPGGKLRSVASPFRIFQQVLKPFGQELYRIIQSLPWDCTFDQTKAIPHIQSCLRQGCQVHSVDLSSATDLFPLSLQITALKAIFRRNDWDHIDLFEEISRGLWSSPIGDLKWTKGQPLGLFPSFGAFTLTHGLLLLHLTGGHYDNQFFVVGDDVVILSDELKNKYSSMLDRMGCPWSADKSISSTTLSEFAGKIITETKVIPQLKWRKMSDDNFLDICRLLGTKSRCLLTERQKAVFDKVAHLCDPIGLNQSLPGDNLEKMVYRTESFYRPERVILGSLMGLRKKLNRLVHTSNASFDSHELEEIALTFDEKVKDVLAQTLFSRWSTSCSMGLDGLSSVPEALGLKPRLPLREGNPTRVTTLERYERLLRHSQNRFM